MTRIVQFLTRKGAPLVRMIVLLSIVANLMILAPSFHMLQVYDRVLASRSVPTLVAITAIALFAIAVYGIAEAMRMRVARRLANTYAVETSPKLFGSLETLDSGADAGKVLRDFQTASGWLGSKAFVNLFDLPFMPLFAVILFLVHPLVCLVAMIGLAIMVAIGWLNVVLTRETAKAGRSADLDANAFAMSAITRGPEIRAFGMLPDLSMQWGLKSARSIVAAEKASHLTGNLSALSRSVRQGIQIVTLGWGAFLVIHGDMSGGMIFMASMISGKLLQPIEQAIAGWEATTKALQSFADLDEVTKSHKRLEERPPLPEPSGQIELRDLSIALDRGRTLLGGVDLRIKPGECVLLEGASGSGKSLLMECIAGGREPSSGLVLMDGAPRGRWPMRQWGRAVGFAPEEPGIVKGTVAMNIARFSPEMDLQEVYRVAQALGLHAAILALPQGYQTQLSEGTKLLSTSQKRLLALARAFYGNPRLLVLDQPTSGLDARCEGALANLVSDAKRDKAAIILVTRSLLLANLVDRCIRIADTRVEDLSITVPGGQGGGQGSPRRMRPRQPNAPAPAKTRIEAAAGPAVQSAEARSVAAPKAPVGQEVSNAAVASGAAQPGSMSNGAMQ